MSIAKHTTGPWFTKREGFSTVYIEARLRQGVIQEVAACGPTEAGLCDLLEYAPGTAFVRNGEDDGQDSAAA